jgi:hypothetical protein
VRLVAALSAALAVAAPVASDVAPSPRPAPTGAVVCTVDDPRATGLSGLVATPDGYVSVVDSQWDQSQVVIVYLDQACHVTRTERYPTPARDPEDLALAPDGTLWSADIGDSNADRQSVALWRIPPDGSAPVIYRLTYPDGPHDAAALLFAAEGSPIIVTKELGLVSHLYQAQRPLEPDTAAGVPMREVGDFRPFVTAAPTDLMRLAQVMVTGAATSPDRKRVALRTYTTAYEWDVPDGDVVKAVTTSTPRITDLPNEPQGESIAYTLDGQQFLTCSDQAGPTQILKYARGTELEPAGTNAPAVPAGQENASAPMLWYGYGLAAVGGAVLLGLLGWLGIRRLRR